MTEDDIVTYVNACIDKISTSGYDALYEVERLAYLVASADFEILLGGLMGFYNNEAGDIAFETAGALQKIGAITASDAIMQSARLFADPDRFALQEYRQDRILALDADFAD